MQHKPSIQTVSMLINGERHAWRKNMEASLHYLLLMTQTVFHKMVLSEAATIGLSPGQPKMLEYLKHYGGCDQRMIGDACNIEAATVTGILVRMEAAGLIERKQLEGNRRSLHVFLTENGKACASQIDDTFKSIEETAFANIPADEQKEFLATLTKIYANLTDRQRQS